MMMFQILGGLALFIYGMQIMTDGLRQSAGSRLRNLSARGGLSGFGFGSVLGITIQSSAATVMLVGLIHAGLMGLRQAVPIILGANVGTTLAMQLIAFRLGDYSYIAIALGFAVRMIAVQERARAAGTALMGFGLLFLGMSLMSDAIRPYREILAAYLTYIDGNTVSGMIIGVLLATAVTAVIQSSGATIAIAFALISAGAITRLSEAYPIILGANLGTCMTALLGSLGTSTQARRAAVAHLVFNLYSCVFGMLTATLFYRAMPLLSSDVVYQAAHANTIKMAITALLVLPIYPRFTAWINHLTPSKTPDPEPSYLDDALMKTPEDAIDAAVRELRRVARICRATLRHDVALLQTHDPGNARRIINNEQAIDTIKRSMDDYLMRLTQGYLSKRQAIMIQHLRRSMSNLERIGDHLDRIREIIATRPATSPSAFDHDIHSMLIAYFDAIAGLIDRVIDSLDPSRADFSASARKIAGAVMEYQSISAGHKARATDTVAAKGIGVPALEAAFIARLIDSFDRIARHCETLAEIEAQPQFYIKPRKLVGSDFSGR